MFRVCVQKTAPLNFCTPPDLHSALYNTNPLSKHEHAKCCCFVLFRVFRGKKEAFPEL